MWGQLTILVTDDSNESSQETFLEEDLITEPSSLPPPDFVLPSTQGGVWFAAELALLRFSTSPAEDPVGPAWSGIGFQWFLWLLKRSGLKCCKHRPHVLPPKRQKTHRQEW